MDVCSSVRSSVHRNTQRGNSSSVICFQQTSLLAESERRRPILAKGMGKEDTFAFRRERPCTKSPPSHHERVHHFLLFLCHECLLCLCASSVSRSVCSTSISYESARKKLGRQYRNTFLSIDFSEITRIRTHARAHTCMYAYTHVHTRIHGRMDVAAKHKGVPDRSRPSAHRHRHKSVVC